MLTATLRPTKSFRKSLALRLSVLTAELAECSTAAMRRSVQESIDDVRRQIAELG